MRERIFRIQSCDDKCIHPETGWCFWISRYQALRCSQCVVKEITEDWVCDDCGQKFDKLVEYFDWYEAPKVAPGEAPVPTMRVIKKLCKDCHVKRDKKESDNES